ncbi:LysE/ArgO family amino acid transporter [Vibrio nitrifigilis]|uniref:Amino acid transporter n=1 Tax=Vibrio nitrifigilis TaxID=2789781 RepID=A0ABS0GGF8_9VIBR|nr:LysE/ArgO family amino acid transporter [Vibrio nitrifigilis]MBF9001415.1 amino acid transporter [Vibrio nitrifigilis]
MNYWVTLQGFILGATMIIPVGAQNAYVLNQGIKRNHHLTTATVCSFLDLIFMSIGIFGAGTLLSQHENVLMAITVAGIVFLSVYGYLSLKSALAYRSNEPQTQESALPKSRSMVIIGALAVTILNPHLYLDSVVILGSLGGQFHGNDRIAFAIGTITASFVWFFTISIGAAKLSSVLSRPRSQQIIDMIVATTMFIIAYSLAKNLYFEHFIK